MKLINRLKVTILKSKLKNGDNSVAIELAHIFLSDTSQKEYEEMGIKYLTLAAQKGVVIAQQELAEYYFHKHYSSQIFNPQIIRVSMYWFIMAADKGSDSAWKRLEDIYSKLDLPTAIDWIGDDIKRSSKHANIMIGNLYCNEVNQNVNYEEAAKAYGRAMDLGTNTEELPFNNLVNMAVNFYKKENFKSAIYWCNITAKQGHGYSQYILGKCYLEGTGVDYDFKISFKYFEESSNNGFLKSKLHLGQYYMKGLGVVDINPQKALELFHEVSLTFKEVYNDIGNYYLKNKDFLNAAVNYEKAQEAGELYESNGELYELAIYFDSVKDYSRAIYWLNLSSKKNEEDGYFILAKYDFFGYFYEKNLEKGIEMLEQLSDKLYQPALRMLYDIYDKGLEGIQQDKEKVFSLLNKLGEADDVEAIKMLGDAFMQKDSSIVNKDYIQASKWYDKWYKHPQKEGKIELIYLEEIGKYYFQIEDYKSAVKWFERAKEEGSIIVSHILGKCYFEGSGVNRDLKGAFVNFQDSLDNGFLESKVYLGQYYMKGLGGVKKDPERALEIFNEVSSNFKEVYNYIGEYYLESKDFLNAIENYEKADEAGVAVEIDEEFYELAMYFHSIQDYPKAMYWLDLSSKKNTYKGYFLLAQYYLYGYHYEKDHEKGIGMLDQLSDKSYEPALKLLYNIYDKGLEGIQKNKELAFKSLIRLGEVGDVDAIKIIGNSFMQNHSDIPKDYVQAAKWYDKWYIHPQKTGSVDSTYLEGIGKYYFLIKDNESAVKWCKRAINEGGYTAYVYLGRIAYRDGNYKEAFNYFSEAAKAHIPEGLANLGICYYHGRGTPIDNVEAYKYLSLAAEKDDVLGMYGQAVLLINKIGVETKKEDDEKIFMLLLRAAEKNYSTAYKLLSNCYELGIGTEVSIDKALYYLFKVKSDKELLELVDEKKYNEAYKYVVAKTRENKAYIYYQMIFTYLGKGIRQDKDAACKMFVDYYSTNSLKDCCGNNETRQVLKYRIAKDVIEAGIVFERNGRSEEAKEYYKAAFRFNPTAGIFLARRLFDEGQCDVLPLLELMSRWNEKDRVYRKCKSIANYMLGLYYEYFYSKITNPPTEYTSGYKCNTSRSQDYKMMMQYYMNSAEDEAYKRIC